MDDYLCLTVLGRPGEGQDDFAERLSRFWSHMLRVHKDDFEKVYAETSEFESASDGRPTLMYLAEESVLPLLERELIAAGIDYAPVDADDRYSKYEAAPPEWRQIEH